MSKPIFKQIIDELIDQLVEAKTFEKRNLDDLKNLLISEDLTKGDIIRLLGEKSENENLGN